MPVACLEEETAIHRGCAVLKTAGLSAEVRLDALIFGVIGPGLKPEAIANHKPAAHHQYAFGTRAGWRDSTVYHNGGAWWVSLLGKRVPAELSAQMDTIAERGKEEGLEVNFVAEVYDCDPLVYAVVEGVSERRLIGYFDEYPKFVHLLRGEKSPVSLWWTRAARWLGEMRRFITAMIFLLFVR